MTPTRRPKLNTPVPTETMRINRYLSIRGITTRKGADEFVKKGLVFINGNRAVLGDKVGIRDKVTIDGVMDSGSYHYFAYCKPKGVTTLPEKNTLSVMAMANSLPKDVFLVGRLDKDSEGLLIITNDGRVTDRLLNPKNENEKEYHAVLNKPITNTLLRGIKEGITVGEFKTRPAKIRKTDEVSFDIILTEGQNREIRRMCLAFGYTVISLKRFRIMSVLLGNLKANEHRELEGAELKTFLRELNLS